MHLRIFTVPSQCRCLAGLAINLDEISRHNNKLIKHIKQVENVQTPEANENLEIIAYNNLACAYSK